MIIQILIFYLKYNYILFSNYIYLVIIFRERKEEQIH